MKKFAFNNTKHASMGYTSFQLNCKYQLHVSYIKDVDTYSKSKAANELTKELRNLIAVSRENLQHVQKPQKQAYNKGIKPRSYTPSKKICLNSKYIKTKRNWKLEVKFF